VAAVHAIEIADGDNGPFQAIKLAVVVVHDDESVFGGRIGHGSPELAGHGVDSRMAKSRSVLPG
jgi:hypothetical protein